MCNKVKLARWSQEHPGNQLLGFRLDGATPYSPGAAGKYQGHHGPHSAVTTPAKHAHPLILTWLVHNQLQRHDDIGACFADVLTALHMPLVLFTQ